MIFNRHSAILAAAALALPAVSFAQEAPAQPETTVKRANMSGAIQTSPIRLPDWPAGFAPKQVQEQAQIFRLLSKATEEAMSRDNFNDFIDRLSEPDRKRLKKDEVASRKSADLNQRIAQLEKKFRQKYDADFGITDPARVFDAPVQVAQGEVSDPNLAKDRFPVPPTLAPEPEAQMASGRIDSINPRFNDDGPKRDQYLHVGRKVAIVNIPSEDLSMPGINASLTHEFLDQWKLDIPDSVTAQRLHDNLLRELSRLDDNSENWPGNVNDTRRLFVQHVLAAAYDLPTAPAIKTSEQPRVDRMDGPTLNQGPEQNNSSRP